MLFLVEIEVFQRELQENHSASGIISKLTHKRLVSSLSFVGI